MSQPSRRIALIGGAALILTAAILYFATYLDTIVSSADENLIDVGEFQIVLNNWGTLHHTGYPLYTIIGASFVQLTKFIGFNPAAGPSIFSIIWALVSLGLLYFFVLEVTGFVPAAVGASLLVGASFSFWINATIPEVYSMYIASIIAILILSRRLSKQWSDKGFLALAVLLGLAGGHHRLAAFILPAVAIYIAPALWRERRRMWWLLPAAGLAGAATFLVYLYLPIRAVQGADFVFGSPNTWDGFWRVFFGPGQVSTVGPVEAAGTHNYGASRFQLLFTVLRSEITLPGILFGLVGLFLLALKRKELATGLALFVTVVVAYAVGLAFPIAAVPGNSLLPGVIALAVGLACIPAFLAQKRPAIGWAAAALLLFLVVRIGVANYQRVHTITHPPDTGRQLLDIFDKVPRSNGGPEPVLMVPWGNDYFLAYFARYISHELDGMTVVDHNANFSEYLAERRPLYTIDSTFWRFPLEDWWDRRFGITYLASAGPRLIQLSDQPIVQMNDIPNRLDTSIGDNITLLGSSLEEVGETTLYVTLYFQAQQPVSADYSISVRLTDQPQIDSPDDILAQQDRVHPIFGWYPTSHWKPGEIVRTFNQLHWDAAERPTQIEVTLYNQIEPNQFNNLDIVRIDLPSQ